MLINVLNEPTTRPSQGCESKHEQTAPFLPRFIIVLPDWDIVKHIGHYKYGISIIAEQVLNWLVKNMTKMVDIRRDDLTRVKKGAGTLREPKFLWVKMINRVGCHDKVLAIRNKFNTLLENALVGCKNHYILDINRKMSDASHFIHDTITEIGAIRYWMELDSTIEQYDTGDASLKPIHSSELQEKRFKLPPVPPKTHAHRCVDIGMGISRSHCMYPTTKYGYGYADSESHRSKSRTHHKEKTSKDRFCINLSKFY